MSFFGASSRVEANGSLPTPQHVLDSLKLAFGEDLGSLECTAGHSVESRRMIVSDSGESIDMLYGELLPDGVSKALSQLSPKGTVLELGMGSGKVAFQVFLQCPNVQQVIGVEISPSRYELSASAAASLAQACPSHYCSSECDISAIADLLRGAGRTPHGMVRGHVLREQSSGRSLWLLEGDLFTVGCAGGPIEEAQAIFMQIRLPADVRQRAYRNLNYAPDGCRVFMLENLAWEYALEEPSNLHPVSEGTIIGDREVFATSWSPKGYPFSIFFVDRQRSPSITKESAVAAVEELYSHTYF